MSSTEENVCGSASGVAGTEARPADVLLAPCPFCGGSELSLRCHHADDAPWYWSVWCSCGSRCRAENASSEDARQQAIAAWNRRAADPVRGELVEALKGFEAWWEGPLAKSLINAGFTGVRVGPQTQAMLDGIRAALTKAGV